MTMTDPIADLLTRIRNAIQDRHDKLLVPASRIKANIVRVLKDEGYIRNFRLVRDERKIPYIKIYLKYTESGLSVIRGIKRISKPGLRRYSGYNNIPRSLGGAGTSLISTSKGVITGRSALKNKIGGEILCEIW